ncbi:hypothetical protein Aperf_G00000112421 [Anoplocephala perfoliata]
MHPFLKIRVVVESPVTDSVSLNLFALIKSAANSHIEYMEKLDISSPENRSLPFSLAPLPTLAFVAPREEKEEEEEEDEDDTAAGNLTSSNARRRQVEEEGFFRELLSRHNQHTYAFDESAFAERVQASIHSKHRALEIHHSQESKQRPLPPLHIADACLCKAKLPCKVKSK